MKTLLLGLVLGLVLVASTMVQANEEMPEVSLIVGATMACENSGGMLAINFKDKKVWMTSRGDKNGVELSNVVVSTYRCPNCYDIKANIFGGDALLKIRGNLQTVKAVMTISAPDAEGDGPVESETMPEMTCRQIK